MRSPATLTTKLLALGVSFLLVAIASIAITLWATWKLDGGAAAVNEAGRMRMQTWQLASAAQLQTAADGRAALLRGQSSCRGRPCTCGISFLR